MCNFTKQPNRMTPASGKNIVATFQMQDFRNAEQALEHAKFELKEARVVFNAALEKVDRANAELGAQTHKLMQAKTERDAYLAGHGGENSA